MASTNTKIVNTTNPVPYDSGTNLAQNWIEVTGAGANTYAIEDNTLSSSLKIIGTTGDKVYIEGNFADYQYKQNGKTITFDNGVARTALTLSSMTSKAVVTTTLVFLDGSVTLSNKAGGVKVSINGYDDNGAAKSQQLTTKYADVKINADDSNTAAATYFAGTPGDTTTQSLTTGIDTINLASVVGANAVINGVQNSSDYYSGGFLSGNTWNTGDSIVGNNLTTVSLVENMGYWGSGAASVVSVTNVAAINVNLVNDSELNAGQFTNVAAVNVTNGITGSGLLVSNATLGTTYGVSGNQYYLDIDYANATGTADTAKLSASGTGTSAIDTLFDVSTGNGVEAVKLATSGTNYLTVNVGDAVKDITLATSGANNLTLIGSSGASTITVTGAGTNDITIASAASTFTFDASATTGSNIVNVGNNFVTGDVFKAGSSTSDELIATIDSVFNITPTPTITGFEELELTFAARSTFNASKWTGGNELDLTPNYGVNATVTNLNQSVATLNIGEDGDINGGNVAIGYATGASSAVTVNVGATSTSANPAVTVGDLTLSGNAGALTINSVGDAANTLGAINANAASALTIARSTQGLTVGDVSATTAGTVTLKGITAGAVNATGAATVTIDGSLNNTLVGTTTVDESLTTLNLTSGAGTATLGTINQTATTGAIATTYNITSGAKDATIGDIRSTAAAGKGLTATVNAVGGAGAIDIGLLGFVGAAAGTTNVTLNATATAGTVTIDKLLVNDNSGSSSSAAAVNLIANGGDVSLSSLELTSIGATNIVISAASGDTATITNLSGTSNLSTISVTGAGDVNLFAGSTDAVTGNTIVDATGLTGSLTLDLGDTTNANNISVQLGNASSTDENNITTGAGADVVLGGTGADTISTGAGIDNVSAGNGNDIVTGGLGADIINVGTGTDTITYLTMDDTLTSITAFSSPVIVTAADIVTGMGNGDAINLVALAIDTGSVGASLTALTADALNLVRGTYNGSTFTAGTDSTDDDYFLQIVESSGTAANSGVVLVDIVGTVTATVASEIITLSVV